MDKMSSGDAFTLREAVDRSVSRSTIAGGRAVADKTDVLIAERGKIHGDFTDHARVTQRLKEVLLDERHRRHERGQPDLTFETLEFLDMAMHKIGRVLSGDADFRNHFDDIGGYARLVAERCSK